jgi:hypothetical protein
MGLAVLRFAHRVRSFRALESVVQAANPLRPARLFNGRNTCLGLVFSRCIRYLRVSLGRRLLHGGHGQIGSFPPIADTASVATLGS